MATNKKRRDIEKKTVGRDAVNQLVDWIVDGARPIADGRKIVSGICERLNAAGIPVDRYALFLFTVHPTIKGRRLSWSHDEGCRILEAGFALFETDEYHDNPLPHVARSQESIRRRICDPDCPDDYKIVGELRADGYTDYLAQPVIYVDGETNTMSWSTRHPAGFSEEAIDALERIRAPMTRLIESYILRLNAVNLISTYAGRNAGERILSGKIKRGDTETFSAAILFADLKNYTALSNDQPAETVIDILNRFYDAFEEPVFENGGEILKFMGDGMLAIFPLSEENYGAAENAAVAAADAVGRARRVLEKESPDIGFRSALHIGSMHYGNIGASRRLDFTAIGPQVNLTARLLSAASSLGIDDVCSAYIGALLADRYEPHGIVELKGFSGSQEIYRRRNDDR